MTGRTRPRGPPVPAAESWAGGPGCRGRGGGRAGVPFPAAWEPGRREGPRWGWQPRETLAGRRAEIPYGPPRPSVWASAGRGEGTPRVNRAPRQKATAEPPGDGDEGTGAALAPPRAPPRVRTPGTGTRAAACGVHARARGHGHTHSGLGAEQTHARTHTPPPSRLLSPAHTCYTHAHTHTPRPSCAHTGVHTHAQAQLAAHARSATDTHAASSTCTWMCTPPCTGCTHAHTPPPQRRTHDHTHAHPACERTRAHTQL